MGAWARWRDEGELIGQGLNIYPLNSRYHFGGYLVIGRLRIYARWSKLNRRLHHSVMWVPPELQNQPRSHWPTT